MPAVKMTFFFNLLHSFKKINMLFILQWLTCLDTAEIIACFPCSMSSIVISFLPRSKCLLISWLQSPSVVILDPKKPVDYII